MPTAIEYAVMKQWHTQNGAGGGPPAQNAVLAQDVTQAANEPLTDPLAALLLVVAVVATIRRRASRLVIRRRQVLSSGPLHLE